MMHCNLFPFFKIPYEIARAIYNYNNFKYNVLFCEDLFKRRRSYCACGSCPFAIGIFDLGSVCPSIVLLRC